MNQTSRIKQLTGQLTAELEAHRTQIARLQAERASLLEHGLDEKSLKQKADALVARLASDADAYLDALAIDAGRHDEPAAAMRINAPHPDGLFGLVVALSGPSLREQIVRRAANFWPNRITPKDRQANLERIDAELLRQERIEEETVRDAEDAGLNIKRRGDANPHVVFDIESPRPGVITSWNRSLYLKLRQPASAAAEQINKLHERASALLTETRRAESYHASRREPVSPQRKEEIDGWKAERASVLQQIDSLTAEHEPANRLLAALRDILRGANQSPDDTFYAPAPMQGGVK